VAAIALHAGSWSILQITEHVAFVERAMLTRLRESEQNLNPPNRERDDVILRTALDRSRQLQAPERAHPTGRYGTLLEARAAVKQGREESIAFIKSYPEDLRTRWVKHPLTELDGYQLVMLMSNHLLRHIGQIEEIEKSPAYQAALEQKAAN